LERFKRQAVAATAVAVSLSLSVNKTASFSGNSFAWMAGWWRKFESLPRTPQTRSLTIINVFLQIYSILVVRAPRTTLLVDSLMFIYCHISAAVIDILPADSGARESHFCSADQWEKKVAPRHSFQSEWSRRRVRTHRFCPNAPLSVTALRIQLEWTRTFFGSQIKASALQSRSLKL